MPSLRRLLVTISIMMVLGVVCAGALSLIPGFPPSGQRLASASGAIIVAVGAFDIVLVLRRWPPEEVRQEWAEQGRCPDCGYDLTGNASGVCPECGNAW